MQAKIMIPLFLILSGIGWMTISNLGKANYFYNVYELPELGDAVYKHGIKVKGRIVAGSIVKDPKPVKFTIHEMNKETGAEKSLQVHYVGTEPLPDLFKDHAEAVVEGSMRPDGVFEAVHLQAKCASKYEAQAPDAADGSSNLSVPAKPEQSGY